MVACLREAIHIRRTQARAWPHFNVLYGTDSESCAHEVEANWRAGNLNLVAKGAIAPLVETWLHLRRELDSLGASFATVKLPFPRGTAHLFVRTASLPACERSRRAGIHTSPDSDTHVRSPHAPPLVVLATRRSVASTARRFAGLSERYAFRRTPGGQAPRSAPPRNAARRSPATGLRSAAGIVLRTAQG